MKTIILTIIFLFISTPLWAIDLQNASLKQLVAERPDLIQDIKAGKDEGTTVVSVVKDAKGRVSIWTEETRDLDNNLVSKRVNTYSYYLTGELNEIVQKRYKGGILNSKKKVKHFKDGRQPTMEIMSIEIPIGP